MKLCSASLLAHNQRCTKVELNISTPTTKLKENLTLQTPAKRENNETDHIESKILVSFVAETINTSLVSLQNYQPINLTNIL